MIVFSILKIIGIIILAVLCLVLILAALLLFVPFRYGIDGSFTDERPDGCASVSWLLSSVKLKAEYHKDEEPRAYISLFGIKIYDIIEGVCGKKKADSPAKAVKSNASKKDPEMAADTSLSVTDKKSETTIKPEASGAAETKNKPQITKSEIIKEKRGSETAKVENEVGKAATAGENTDSKKLSFTERIGHWIDRRLTKLYETISRTVSKICTLIKELYTAVKDKTDKLKKLYELYHEEKYAPAVALFKHCALQIINEIKPVNGLGHLTYGSGDPCSTGTVMEIAAVLYPVYSGFFEIVPDFEQSRLEARLNIRGRIRIFFIGVPALRIFFNKGLKSMYKKARSILESGE